ncbi:hypothetical protein ACVIW0_002236 [Bradyrhizobium sp. USDA 4454]
MFEFDRMAGVEYSPIGLAVASLIIGVGALLFG